MLNRDMTTEEISAKLTKYTAKAEEMDRERNQKKGKLDGAEERLRKIGYESVEEANKVIEQKLALAKENKEELLDLMEEFEGLYAGILQD